MKRLFESVGVSLTQSKENISFGASVREGKIYRYTRMGSSAYNAGLEKGDKIVKVDDFILSDDLDFNTIINKFKPNDEVIIIYERYGNTKTTTVTLQENPSYTIVLFENANDEQKENREAWLNTKK